MLCKQIEKKIDVLQANCFVDDEIFILETSLLKLSTPLVLANPEISRIVRRFDARIVEVNPTYTTVEKTGVTSDVLDHFNLLNELGCVLQFVRSGRIAITPAIAARRFCPPDSSNGDFSSSSSASPAKAAASLTRAVISSAESPMLRGP